MNIYFYAKTNSNASSMVLKTGVGGSCKYRWEQNSPDSKEPIERIHTQKNLYFQKIAPVLKDLHLNEDSKKKKLMKLSTQNTYFLPFIRHKTSLEIIKQNRDNLLTKYVDGFLWGDELKFNSSGVSDTNSDTYIVFNQEIMTEKFNGEHYKNIDEKKIIVPQRYFNTISNIKNKNFELCETSTEEIKNSSNHIHFFLNIINSAHDFKDFYDIFLPRKLNPSGITRNSDPLEEVLNLNYIFLECYPQHLLMDISFLFTLEYEKHSFKQKQKDRLESQNNHIYSITVEILPFQFLYLHNNFYQIEPLEYVTISLGMLWDKFGLECSFFPRMIFEYFCYMDFIPMGTKADFVDTKGENNNFKGIFAVIKKLFDNIYSVLFGIFPQSLSFKIKLTSRCYLLITYNRIYNCIEIKLILYVFHFNNNDNYFIELDRPKMEKMF